MAVKLLPLKVTISSTMIVSVGTASFQIIVMLFDSASHRTPMMLMNVNTAMQTPATAIPDAVSVPLAVHKTRVKRSRLQVGERRLDLDRGDRDRLDPGHPSTGEAAQRAEAEERKARRATGQRIGRAQLGVHERENAEDRSGQDPGQERGRTR